MAIANVTTKLLWAAAAGKCSFANCNELLFIVDGEESCTIGEMAHICGEKPGSCRYNSAQTPEQRDAYENLILLCPNHHTIVDKPKNAYSVEVLKKMKTDHERKVSESLGNGLMDLETLAGKLHVFLAENHAAWIEYGPLSERARNFPHSERLHGVWVKLRLTKIVPNNRKSAKLLEAHRQLFTASAQDSISEFLIHVESYENWVRSESDYDAVVRFPLSFQELVVSCAHARP